MRDEISGASALEEVQELFNSLPLGACYHCGYYPGVFEIEGLKEKYVSEQEGAPRAGRTLEIIPTCLEAGYGTWVSFVPRKGSPHVSIGPYIYSNHWQQRTNIFLGFATRLLLTSQPSLAPSRPTILLEVSTYSYV